MKLRHIIICQNKIDLVKESQALEQQQQIINFVKGAIRLLLRLPPLPLSLLCLLFSLSSI